MSSLANIGVIARKVIEHLQSLAPHEERSSGQLSELLQQPVAGFGSYLAQAVRAGWLVKRIQGRAAYWSLGPSALAVEHADAYEAGDGERVVRIVSAGATPSIFAYARERHAAPFSVAKSTDGRLIVERFGRVVCEFTDTERRKLLAAAEKGVA